MAQKVLRVYVDQSLTSLSHPIKIPTLAFLPLKNFWGQNFFHVFNFCSTIFKPVFLEIGERSTKQYFNI